MSSDESIWSMRVLSTSMPEYVGELIRCKDCKHATDDGYGCDFFSHYEQDASYRWEEVPAEVEPNGFCSWAEKRED